MLTAGDQFHDPADLLGSLIPLMRRYGVRCSPLEFYELVNVHFHAAESLVYDEIHRGMWQSLPRQFELLTDDCAAVAPKGKLRVLDIGCGTGLSAEFFLKTRLGSRTSEIHLLDTSKEMLGIATRRARSWPVDVISHSGKISDLPADRQFDVILASSVLHHIADLRSFLNEVAERLSVGGLFLHLQDPNADYADDPEHLSRLTEYKAARPPARKTPLFRRLTPRRIYKRVLRQFKGRQDYIGQTNRSLMRAGVIEREMSEGDIWLVTDIHVSPITKGISLQALKSMLPRYEFVSYRTYEFFGELGDHLPERFRVKEEQLIDGRSLTGGLFAAAWRLPPD
jgi:ubiquinone/menaquinone biosynthesis C-methylase UbiE